MSTSCSLVRVRCSPGRRQLKSTKETVLPIGRIVRFNADRGFGFVRSDYPRCEDVFIYGAVLRRAGMEPIIGTSLEFETEMHKGRLRVKSAKRLGTWRDLADTTTD